MTNNRLEEIRAKLGDVLGALHVINSEAGLLVNFTDDPNLKPKERGLKIQSFRLKAHRVICEALDALDARPAVAADARELAQGIRIGVGCSCGVGSLNYTCMAHQDIETAITTYANQRGEEAWREGVEAAARVADDCNYHKDDCKQCLQATTIAMLIRALINRPS